jgi:monoamine oxidase
LARTPLAQWLEGAAAAARPKAGGVTRRDALRRAGAAGAAAATAGTLGALSPRAARAATGGTRIGVIGAGLAGLSAAYSLQQAGLRADVHEAHPTRAGGRCWSDRSFGQVFEHGGELIDQGHTAVRQLAQGLGLTLDNLLSAEQNGSEATYYFDGEPYPFAQATDDLKAIWQQIHGDVSAASYPTLYNLSTERGRELDAMSITKWIASYVPGGTRSKLGQLLDVAYNIEYGAECSQQSSLNMLYLLGYSGQGQLRIFGPSNEKYHVRGGNDLIPNALVAKLDGQIAFGSELVALRPGSAAGTWVVSLRQGATTRDVTYDRVVLALPFSILRSSVDLSRAGFPARKTTAIDEMGMGTNSKLHLQFASRHWNTLGSNGETYADTGYQNTWEVTRAQPGTSGILVNYTGGTIGASFGSGTPASRAKQFLGQVEPVLPGITPKWNGRAAVDWWQGYPWTKGSYSYWKVGQYTKFAGAEREAVGSCHFAGEHTSIDFQGYLNGAVETGQRAAGEILSALKR